MVGADEGCLPKSFRFETKLKKLYQSQNFGKGIIGFKGFLVCS